MCELFRKEDWLQISCWTLCPRKCFERLCEDSWGQGNGVLKFVLGLAAAACGPLMFCWFGTNIIQESLAVQQEAYGCSWYHRPTSFKCLLAVVIMRAQKPVRLNAGMFYDLSLTTFTQMLNTVYTYFAVLKQLYDE